MSESDYERGYRQGFVDGFNKGKEETEKVGKGNPWDNAPWPLNPWAEPPKWDPYRCPTCGIEFKGAWGWVCSHPKCPTRVTC